MKASEIAGLICLVADSAIQGHIPLESHSRLNQSLWGLTRELGLDVEVDRILQDTSLNEMNEAMKRMEIE